MAGSITTCNSFKLDTLNGVHQPGDVYKIALYTSTTGLSEGTTIYSTANEVAANAQTKYTTGGLTMTGRTAVLDQGTGVLDWDDPVWANSSIQAAGALIYNASKGNKALVVLDFGGLIESRNGPFAVRFPPATAATGLITQV